MWYRAIFRMGYSFSYSSDTILSMSSGEIFPNAPLALVAAEVRYPAVTEGALSMAIHRRIRDALGSDWVIHNDTTQTFEVGVDATGPRASSRSETVGRIASRQRTKTITAGPENFILEVVDYEHFADFRGLLERVSSAIQSVLKPDGISRVGLRYVDEITVPEPKPQWSQWLDSSLMAPSLPPGLTPTEWTGAVQYQVAPDQSLVFRYGPSAGPVVSTGGTLRRPLVPDGPIFVLDFDSSWQPSDIPEFTADRILEAADRLRSPLRVLFGSLVTPPLLEVFREDPRND